MADTLAERLLQIIAQQGVTKREFARRIGVGESYVYILTGGGRKNALNRNISPALARVIGSEFGYDAEWILHGEASTAREVETLRSAALEQVEQLSPDELLLLQSFLTKIRKDAQ